MFSLVGGQNKAVEPSLVSVSGVWIWPRFHAFRDVIWSTCQALVFTWACPKGILGKSCPVNDYCVLIDIY